MNRAEISGISPFFIVKDAAAALSFYRDRLGFDIIVQEPTNDPFFGIVRRGGAMILLKSVGADPLPNYKRQPQARWDAYLDVPDPDALAAELSSRRVASPASSTAPSRRWRSNARARCLSWETRCFSSTGHGSPTSR
jgi:catechol 2,3-dioxygenase-like lactoylglutathione lyase family enzyme